MYSVLFVCSANICRSPMAEGLLKAIVRNEADAWRIESAGVWAMDSFPAAENTIEVLGSREVDLSGHGSRRISEGLVDDFNLILVMEKNHQEALQAAFPQHAGKIYLMSEMVGKQLNVADPIGLPYEAFEETAREIESILRQALDKIRGLAEERIDQQRG